MSSKERIEFMGKMVDPFRDEMFYSKPSDDRVCLSDFTKELADMFSGLGQDIINASKTIADAMDDLATTIEIAHSR